MPKYSDYKGKVSNILGLVQQIVQEARGSENPGAIFHENEKEAELRSIQSQLQEQAQNVTDTISFNSTKYPTVSLNNTVDATNVVVPIFIFLCAYYGDSEMLKYQRKFKEIGFY